MSDLVPGWRIKHHVRPKTGKHTIAAVNIDDPRRYYSATATTFETAIAVVKRIVELDDGGAR